MSNWFTSTLQTVRERSFDAFEFVRKDLSEFTTTVKSDAENYLTKFRNESIKPNENVRRSTVPIDRLQSEKFRFENDESTYLIDPEPIENYEKWLKENEFNDENHKNELTQIFIDFPHIRAHYSRLVPTMTSHNQFWSRYFYRLSLFEQNERRRIQLLKRAEEICHQNEFQRTKSSDWDDPDDDSAQHHESDTISTGDSWEKEFDEHEIQPTSMTSSTTTKQTENDINDDDWESWS